MTVDVDIKKLLETGVHFGHKTSRWHPKMAGYIHSNRGDSHIIDLTKTVEALDVALPVISKVAASGQKVLFVGTKKQMREAVKETAESVDQPYVTERWIGGVLTNSETINRQIKKLHNLEKRMSTGELENHYSKLEVQRFGEEIIDLNVKYGGIKDLSGKPGLLFVASAVYDINAIKEAKTLKIPVVALADTNADPSLIDYVIPANDDAISGVKLILSYVAEAVKQGQAAKDKKVKE
jgi:small subunit ribosomal protein S2